jgi:hypothetical protein
MHRRHVKVRLAGVWLCGLLALPAAANERRPGAAFDYCGFGTGAAQGAIEPGGGGDTMIITANYAGSYHYIYDRSSPVTLDNHDRFILSGIEPAKVELKRVNDSLAFCIPSMPYELHIEGHYCHAEGLSPIDTDNHEVEEIRFLSTGEIWLSDALIAAYRENPQALDLTTTDELGPIIPPGQWKVRPFSEVMPNYSKPALDCH